MCLQGGEWVHKEPKTPAPVPSITVSAVTAELLAEHLDRFAGPGVDGLLFPNGASKPVASSGFWNNHFRRALASTGLRRRFHDLRHRRLERAVMGRSIADPPACRVGHRRLGHGLLAAPSHPARRSIGDHGAQYTSWAFGQQLCHAGLVSWMGSVGVALDNVVAESFFATLQTELLDRHRWTSRKQLAQAIFERFEVFCSQQRRHSTLGMLDPVTYDTTHRSPSAA